MNRSLGCLIGALLLSLATPALADVLTLQVDNDGLVSSDDDHYTSGVEFGWARSVTADHWSQSLMAGLPDAWWRQVDSVGYRVSHRMYTPVDVERRNLIPDDRPYAGLVLAGFSLHEIRQRGAWERLNVLQFDVGLVGPATGTDSLQREVHRFTNSDRPRGWRHQLGNEPLFNLAYRRSWWRSHQLAGLEWLHGPAAVGAVGNLITQAGLGYGLRLGHGMVNRHAVPSAGPERMGLLPVQHQSGFGWQLFAGAEGRYVAHNLLLDGNTLRDSHSVERQEFVADAIVGLALSWERWQASLAHVWRSKEFRGQESADTHGSLSLSYRL